MKTSVLLNSQICTCPNQHLLVIGQSCDLCMGVVVSQLELQHEPAPMVSESFDLSYFEALERHFEKMEFAA